MSNQLCMLRIHSYSSCLAGFRTATIAIVASINYTGYNTDTTRHIQGDSYANHSRLPFTFLFFR